MKKIYTLIIIYIFSVQLEAQDFYKYEFGVVVLDSVIEYATVIDTGVVWEDSSYIIPEHDFNNNFPVIQFLYNAFAGSKFLFGDLTDEKILISIKLVFNKKDGLPPIYFNERLFFVLIVDVFKMPGRIKVTEDYIFKPGQYFGYILPKTEDLLNVFKTLNINKDDLGFAYIRDDRFEGKDIETINTPESVRFRARHFSKFGGGRGHITGTTGVGDNSEPLLNFALLQNYPNPFNPTTTIKYSIPDTETQDSKTHRVILRVYDILGSQVAELVNKNQSPGNYTVNFNASSLTSGIYFYRITVASDNYGSSSITKKMILLK